MDHRLGAAGRDRGGRAASGLLQLRGGQDADTVSAASGYRHVSGAPGAGETAPPFTLPSTTGGRISLSDYRGQSVLLYFQGGLMCQPCFDQIADLEQNRGALRAAGIDEVVSISERKLRRELDRRSSTTGETLRAP